jgi:hypothetical protein
MEWQGCTVARQKRRSFVSSSKDSNTTTVSPSKDSNTTSKHSANDANWSTGAKGEQRIQKGEQRISRRKGKGVNNE